MFGEPSYMREWIIYHVLADADGRGDNGVDTHMGTTPLLNYAKERSEFITNQLAE